MAHAPPRPDSDEPPPEARKHRHPRARKVARTGALSVLTVVLVVVALFGVLVVVLQTEFGRGQVQSIAVGQIEALLSETATLELDRLEGTFITGATMTGLRVREGNEPAVEVDTLYVRYRLLSLLRNSFRAHEADLRGLRVFARQSEDATWNLSRIFEPGEEPRDTTAFGWTIQIRDLSVRNVDAEVHFYNPERDSVLTVDALALDARRFQFDADGLQVQLDTLTTVVTPASLDPEPVALATSATVDTSRVDIGGLTLWSNRTDLRAVGSADWSGEALVLNADVRATPLDFADVRQFVPVSVFGVADIEVTARGTTEELIADARAAFEDNGTIELGGTFTPRTDGPVRYRLDGEVATFDPGRLLGNPALAGAVSGTLSMDVAGPVLEQISGPVDVRLRSTAFADQQIERADLDGMFENGTLGFTLGLAVPGGRGIGEGFVSPFAEPMRYDVQATLSDLDLNLLADTDGRIARADVAVAGQGTDPARLVADVRATLQNARFGDLALDRAALDGTLANGFLRFNANTIIGNAGGAAQAQGSARLFREPLTYEITRGSVADLNLAAITGDPGQQSRITGRFALSGTGTDLETAAIDLSAALDPSTYQTFSIADATLTASLRSGTLNFDTAADLGAAGAIAAVGTTRPFSEPLAVDATGTVRGLDVAAFSDDPEALDTDLTGSFAVDLVGTDPETLSGTVRLDLAASRFGAQTVDRATLAAAVENGTIDGNLDVRTPEGFLVASALVRPFADVPTATIREGRFGGINLALLLDNPDLQTDLTGRIEDARIVGFEPGALTADARLILENSVINAGRIDQGLVTLAVRPDTLTADATLALDRGFATARFGGNLFADVPTYALAAEVRGVEVLSFVGDTTDATRLTARLDLDGAGFDPETMRLDAQLLGERSRFAETVVDTLVATVSLRDGLLRVPELLVEAPFADAQGSGQIALFDTTSATDFRFAALIREAGPLNAFLDEALLIEPSNLNARVIGEPGEPIAFDAQLIARQLTYGQFGATRLDARLDGTYDLQAAEPIAARTRVRFDFVSLPTFNVRDGDVTATFLEGELGAEGRFTVDDRRDLAFAFALEGVDEAEQTPTERAYTQVVRLDALDLRLDDDEWELLQPARIAFGDGRFRIRNLLLESEGQQIAADGEVDFEGEQTLVLTTDNVRLAALADLAGFEGLDGRVSVQLSLLGPAEAPEIDATLLVEDIMSNGDPVGSLRANAAFAEQRLNLGALLTHVEGQTLTAEGFLPFAFRLDGGESDVDDTAPVELRVVGEAFPIAWAEPFLPPDLLTELDGLLTADVTVGGTQSSPQLDGEARLAGGRLGLEATGNVVFQDIALALGFAGNTATITEARIRDGRGGTLTADGTITLPELSVGELDLRLRIDQFRVIDTPTFRALTLTATPGQNLRFSGTLTEPELTGGVTLASGDIFLTDELIGPDLEAVELTEAQIQRIEATFGTRVAVADTSEAAFVDNLRLNLDVNIERNVWLRSRRNPRLDVEFSGNVAVEKERGGENQLFGSIDVTRGRVELPTLAGRAFTIGQLDGTYGQLTFNGPFEETVVDLRAGFEASAGLGRTTVSTIFLGFSGRLAETPEIELSSDDPPMETADIACVIATGRPCGETFQGGAVEDIALNQLGAIVQGVAAGTLGLDVVEITQRPTGEIVITFGSYVTDRTFAAVSQPVNETDESRSRGYSRAPELTIEYEALRWLMLRGQRRNEGGVGGTVFVQFDY